MYLIDTNVISEARKGERANAGVRRFFEAAARDKQSVYLSVVTLGELRRGIARIRRRGDRRQAEMLERWLESVVADFDETIVPIDSDVAQVWGRLRDPHPENALDKLIAATALLYGLTVVSRNVRDFEGTGAEILDPFD